jgi:hypothetical protein
MAGRSDEYTLKLMRNTNSVPTNSGHTPDKVPPNRIEKKRIEQKGMKKPALDMVKARCREMNYPGRIAARFYNYYESNGWRVGKNPMKSWQAALANWNSKEQGQSGNEEYVR